MDENDEYMLADELTKRLPILGDNDWLPYLSNDYEELAELATTLNAVLPKLKAFAESTSTN
jgi:hypothetical protein